MSDNSNEKTTLYLDPRVKRTAQFYALRDRRSLSDVVNESLLRYLEDLADIAVVEERKGEPTESFEHVVKELGFSLDEIQGTAKKERTKRAAKAR
jgi:DNA primase large subunit